MKENTVVTCKAIELQSLIVSEYTQHSRVGLAHMTAISQSECPEYPGCYPTTQVFNQSINLSICWEPPG